MSGMDSELDYPTFVEKAEVDGRNCSVIAPTKFGGTEQMRKRIFMCLMCGVLFCI